MFLLALLACGSPTSEADKAADTAKNDTGAPDSGSDSGDDSGSDSANDSTDDDGDGYAADDCDDTDVTVHPGATETCDGRDEDCDDAVDEDAADATAWYSDDDGDSYGRDDSVTLACRALPRSSARGGDCDDRDATVHPDAAETCDGRDEDCDGEADEGPPADARLWYPDLDGDHWGESDGVVRACEAPAGTVPLGGDCDDTLADVRPDADERCNGHDDDCDGDIDEPDAIDAATWYLDADGDGYGDADVSTPACAAPVGWVADATDCDDGAAGTNPGADEVCDHLDDDCDGAIDEADATDMGVFCVDADGDGYGDPMLPVQACFDDATISATGDDCDDADASVHPGAPDTCDGADTDCDGRDVVGPEVPEDWATIQEAVTAAVDGDTVCVGPGTWAGAVELLDREIELVGALGWEVTILVGGGASSALTIGEDAGSPTIDGLTITGGDGDSGAGVHILGSTPTLRNLRVTGNTCTGTYCAGGGVMVESHADAVIEDTLIDGNVLTGWGRGAGLFVGPGHSAASVTLRRVEVADNEVHSNGTRGAGGGIGVAIMDSDSTFEDVYVHGNLLQIEGTSAEGLGGGMYVQDGRHSWTDLRVDDNIITVLDPASRGSGWRAGGVALVGATVSWVGGSISGNRIEGTVDRTEVFFAGGLDVEAGASASLAQLLIAENAVDCHGCAANAGGIAVSDVLALRNVIVADNLVAEDTRSAYGGGIVVSSSDGALDLVNCDIVGNEVDAATTATGGGLYLETTTTVRMESTNVVGNRLTGATLRGGAVYLPGAATPLSAAWSNFHDNTESAFYNLDSPVGADGNFDADPLYVDTSAASGRDWDLALGAGSACIDAGDPSARDGDGSVADVGAFGGPEGSW